VGICLSHDAADQPTEPVACPANTTRSREDNSCVLQRCDRVLIQQSGDCGGR
jgi:hypothetical protein